MILYVFTGMGTLSSFYSKETIKEAKKIDIRPEMLEVHTEAKPDCSWH